VIGVPAGGAGSVDDVWFRVDVRGWAPRTRVESAGMKANRSIPASTVIPVLIYPDVREAVAWLSAAFGFVERVRIGENHRTQLRFGGGA
jgi:hypothetical protein